MDPVSQRSLSKRVGLKDCWACWAWFRAPGSGAEGAPGSQFHAGQMTGALPSLRTQPLDPSVPSTSTSAAFLAQHLDVTSTFFPGNRKFREVGGRAWQTLCPARSNLNKSQVDLHFILFN